MVLQVTEENVLGTALCSAVGFLDNTLVVVSMWTLLLTSIDRYSVGVLQCCGVGVLWCCSVGVLQCCSVVD